MENDKVEYSQILSTSVSLPSPQLCLDRKAFLKKKKGGEQKINNAYTAYTVFSASIL